MRTSILVTFLLMLGCGGGDAATTPPVGTPPVGTPPVGTPPVGTPPGTGATPPPGTVMVTVSAASTPPGASVTGGGTLLGTTPFVTSVPVPAPTPGVAQTFEFTFQYPGYTATTITASPTNGTITLNAVLAPMGVAGMPPGTPPGLGVVPPGTGVAPPGAGGLAPPGTRFTIRGTGGGSIYDYHTTTATAEVPTMCRIRELRVDIDGRHTFNSDLVVRLRAPDGTAFSLQSHNRRNPFRTHTVRRAAGIMANGHWELEIEDTVGADSGNLSGFELDITCG